MGNHDELLIEKIDSLKEDIGEIKIDIKDIKRNCACRLVNCSKEIKTKMGFKGFIATLSLFLMGVGVVLVLV